MCLRIKMRSLQSQTHKGAEELKMPGNTKDGKVLPTVDGTASKSAPECSDEVR